MKKAIWLLAVVYVLIGASTVWSDATIETILSSGGLKGMGATEGSQIRRYQDEKMYESTSSKFTGVILSRIGGGTESITITRVDKGIYWILDPKSKTYTEQPIAPIEHKQKEAEPTKREGKPTSRVTKSEFNVKKTGASETINGFACREYLMTWLLEVEDLETKAKTRFLMENHLWNTPQTAAIKKLQAEEQKFHKALAKKIGILSTMEAKQMGMEALSAMANMPDEEMKKGMSRMKNEMAKIEGYSIRTIIGWTAEGDAKSAKGRTEEVKEDKPFDLSGGLGGLISGMAGKVIQKKGQDKAAADKDAPFFTATTEVKSINTDALPADTFDIPKGFKKKAE